LQPNHVVTQNAACAFLSRRLTTRKSCRSSVRVTQKTPRCISWAKHRRRKAAAKLHLRMDFQTHLPKFAIINTANEHDSRQAAVVSAGVRSGENSGI
jgi:hypothetical protein